MRRTFWSVILLFVSISPARAIDAEANQPYDFQVLVRIVPHGLLTPVFRRQLHSDLQDNLQAALGMLAQVEIRDAAGDWLDLATLDSHVTLHPAKRHFVEVAYVAGQYVVRARQLDGSTGLASPIVREERTADRAFVARLVTRCIDQDFGAVGTVVARSGEKVTLRLRGAAIPGADAGRWVPAGSVFALVRIEGHPPRGREVEAALLRTLAEPKNGDVECQFFYRFRDAQQRDPLADWPQVGFRAMRLGTTTAPVKLRLVDALGLPRTDLQVAVSRTSFRDAPQDQGAARDGNFATAGLYSGMAFVRVTSGERQVAQVPVAILEDRAIVCRVTAEPNGEARQVLEIDAGNLQQSLLDAVRRLGEQLKTLATLTAASQNKEALAKLKDSLNALDEQVRNATTEIGRLRRESQRLGVNLGATLAQCEETYLKELQRQRQRLMQSQDDLEKAINIENSPEKQQEQERFLALLRRAVNEYDDAEFDKAIETYKDILQLFNERPEVRRRLEELEKAWVLKGDAQRSARSFAYGTWARLTSAEDLRTNLPKAREAFDACRAGGDRLTARKLFLVATQKATDIVAQRYEELAKGQTDEDKKLLEQWQKVLDELQALIKEMGAFVQEGEKRAG